MAIARESNITAAHAQRRAFYERISVDNMTPLWEVLASLRRPHYGVMRICATK
jgi:hypothetical protein